MVLIAAILWSAVLAVVVGAAYGAFIGARRLRVDTLTVTVPRLPPELSGLRIVHIADTHFKPTAFYDTLYEQMFNAIDAAQPDIVMITGDIASGNDYFQMAARRLSRLKSRYGVFAVAGNHDLNITMERWLQGTAHLADIEEMKRTMARAGMTLLHNEHVVLEIAGRKVAVVGVGDASVGLDDVPAALAALPEADFVVVLSHSPDVMDSAGMEVADLVLCGHTHAGQFMLPGIGPLWAPVWRDRRRGVGLLVFGDVVGHVTRGVGSTWPFRIGCPPQVAVLDLQPGPPRGRKLPPELRHPLRTATQAAAGGEGE
ncbi:MAG: metallophosphoesterase [Armatimonadetes bacterium]|nr:metallophosphoesterase [Armatimonadota bacterium]